MAKTIASGKWLDLTIKAVVVLAVIYHLSSVYFRFHTAVEYLNTHLLFTLVIAGLAALRKWPKSGLWWLLFIAFSIISCSYVQINHNALEMRAGFPTTPDMFIGVILVVISLVACWWAFGPAVPILVTIFIAYAVFGFLIPGYFRTYPPEFPRLISHLSIGLQGVYSILLSASAHYIFLFILFGGILQSTAARELFAELGRLVARGTRGGTAHTAVVSSGLIGMVTGAAAANVAITGAVTIPTMKRTGYTPEQAGAFEAAASNGGQIMPPVMGASAFVMAELTGIGYFEICIAAFIPAIIYFLGIGAAVELRGRRLNMPKERTPVDYQKLFVALPLFIIPLGVLVVLLGMRYSPNYAAFWAIIALLITTYMRKGTWLPLSRLVEGLETGVITGVRIAASCAGLGLLLRVMTTTGLSVKLPQFVEMGSQGNMWLALVLTLFISLILGCGLPTLAAYLIVAVVTAPALVAMGIPLLAAHLAAFYFAIFAGVTPPFAPTALVASGMAQSSFPKTALEGVKVAFPGLMLPFLWVVNPTLLANFSDPLLVAMTFVGILFFLVAINALFVGFYVVKLKMWERAVMAVSALVLGFSIASADYPIFGVGAFMFIAVTIWQFQKSKRERQVI